MAKIGSHTDKPSNDRDTQSVLKRIRALGPSSGILNRSTMTKPRAYSYIRFSTLEQRQGDSFRRQTEKARLWAERNGYELDSELTLSDLGVSAFRGRNVQAGALGEFMRAVDQGVVAPGSALLIESLDRLSRAGAWEALPTLQAIINADVTVVTLEPERVLSRDEVTTNPFLLMEAILMLVRANEESETKSKRVRAAWQSKRNNLPDGRSLTSMVPAWIKATKRQPKGDEKPDLRDGSKLEFEVNPERARIVQEVYELTAQGIGKDTIAATFNQRSEPTWEGIGGRKAASQWHGSRIQRMLDTPAVIGTFVPHETQEIDGRMVRVPGEPVPDYFPPVVSTRLYNRAQAVRSTPSPRGRNARQPMQNILSGLARCPKCGASMVRENKGKYKGKPQVYFVCTKAKSKAGCIGKDEKAPHIPYDPVEVALIRRADQIIEEAPVGDETLDAQIDDVDAAINGLTTAADNLLDEVQAGGGSNATRQRLKEIEGLIQEAMDHQAALWKRADEVENRLVEARLEELGDALEAEPLDRQRVNAALSVLVEGVTVDYQSGQLVFHWRHGGETEVTFGWINEALQPKQ